MSHSKLASFKANGSGGVGGGNGVKVDRFGERLLNGIYTQNAENENVIHTKQTRKSNVSSTSAKDEIGLGLEWYEMELDYLCDDNYIAESPESQCEVRTSNKGGRPKKNRLTKCSHYNKTPYTYVSSNRCSFLRHMRKCAKKHGVSSSPGIPSD